MWFKSRLERQVSKAVRAVFDDYLVGTEGALEKIRTAFSLEERLAKLREELEAAKLEKARRDEEFARREREIEHKVGLERKRQEFEVSQAKREATVSVREENLKHDRERFEQQLKFHEERFTAEVGYLKGMLEQMMKRLPSAEIILKKTE